MNTAGLFKALSAIHPLSTGFKKSLTRELIPLSLPGKYFLVEAPRITEHLYYIDKGFSMSYRFQDAKKIVETFWRAGEIMTSVTSFYEQVPSTEFIQLLMPSELLCLSHAGLHRLFRVHDEAHFIYHKILNNHYEQCRQRIFNIQRLTASQRFESLLASFPDIEQIVTQENIASYLAITPQSLSRLKRMGK